MISEQLLIGLVLDKAVEAFMHPLDFSKSVDKAMKKVVSKFAKKAETEIASATGDDAAKKIAKSAAKDAYKAAMKKLVLLATKMRTYAAKMAAKVAEKLALKAIVKKAMATAAAKMAIKLAVYEIPFVGWAYMIIDVISLTLDLLDPMGYNDYSSIGAQAKIRDYILDSYNTSLSNEGLVPPLAANIFYGINPDKNDDYVTELTGDWISEQQASWMTDSLDNIEGMTDAEVSDKMQEIYDTCTTNMQNDPSILQNIYLDNTENTIYYSVMNDGYYQTVLDENGVEAFNVFAKEKVGFINMLVKAGFLIFYKENEILDFKYEMVHYRGIPTAIHTPDDMKLITKTYNNLLDSYKDHDGVKSEATVYNYLLQQFLVYKGWKPKDMDYSAEFWRFYEEGITTFSADDGFSRPEELTQALTSIQEKQSVLTTDQKIVMDTSSLQPLMDNMLTGKSELFIVAVRLRMQEILDEKANAICTDTSESCSKSLLRTIEDYTKLMACPGFDLTALSTLVTTDVSKTSKLTKLRNTLITYYKTATASSELTDEQTASVKGYLDTIDSSILSQVFASAGISTDEMTDLLAYDRDTLTDTTDIVYSDYNTPYQKTLDYPSGKTLLSYGAHGMLDVVNRAPPVFSCDDRYVQKYLLRDGSNQQLIDMIRFQTQRPSWWPQSEADIVAIEEQAVTDVLASIATERQTRLTDEALAATAVADALTADQATRAQERMDGATKKELDKMKIYYLDRKKDTVVNTWGRTKYKWTSGGYKAKSVPKYKKESDMTGQLYNAYLDLVMEEDQEAAESEIVTKSDPDFAVFLNGYGQSSPLYTIKAMCDDMGGDVTYNAEKGLCNYTKNYCDSMGLSYEYKPDYGVYGCYMPKSQLVFEYILGTTFTRMLRAGFYTSKWWVTTGNYFQDPKKFAHATANAAKMGVNLFEDGGGDMYKLLKEGGAEVDDATKAVLNKPSLLYSVPLEGLEDAWGGIRNIAKQINKAFTSPSESSEDKTDERLIKIKRQDNLDEAMSRIDVLFPDDAGK
jgi:hypothetical protein